MTEPTIYTTADKAKRDELFQLFRKSTDPLERQVVKFSGNEPISGEFDNKGRQKFQSTWSVSHPSE
jgi:hypothetical protein